MAELIPLEYRIQTARQSLMSRWMTIGLAIAVLAGVGLTAAYVWRVRQAGVLASLQREYHSKAVLITQAQELQAQRVNLAGRMQKLQTLENDNVLLSLLKDVSDGFSESDCVQFVQIDAHDAQAAGKPGSQDYWVRVRGITASDTSHSKLLERLTAIGKKSSPPIDVPMGEKQLREVMDGEVTVFDLTCKQPQAKGT